MEVVVTAGDITSAKLQSNCQHQQTNTQLFTDGSCSFLLNKECQSTEGKAVTNSNKELLHRYITGFLMNKADMFSPEMTQNNNTIRSVFRINPGSRYHNVNPFWAVL